MAARNAAARLAKPASSLVACARRIPTAQPFRTSLLTSTQATNLRMFSAARTAFAKKYTEDHEWIELDSDGTTGTMGISTYAAKALGDVVYVELPQADTEATKGDTIGAVESVKSASDILSPVSGTVIEANNALEETPGTINKSPEADGWIAKIKVKDTSELDDLMDKEKYDAFTEGESE